MKRKADDDPSGSLKKRAPSLDIKTVASPNDLDLSQPLLQQPVGFKSLPYDVRFQLWKETLQDRSRVVKTTARITVGSSQTSDIFVSDFLLHISPARDYVAMQASVWFGPDIRASPTIIGDTLDSNRSLIRQADNIMFLENLPGLLKPVFEELSTREQDTAKSISNNNLPTFSFHASCPGVKAIAFGILPDSISRESYYGDPNYVPYKSYIISLLYCLVDIQTVYLVLDTEYNPAITSFKKPRFVNGTTGFSSLRQPHTSSPLPFQSHELQHRALAAYQRAYQWKSAIMRGISKRNVEVASENLFRDGPEYPKRVLDIKIVQWEE